MFANSILKKLSAISYQPLAIRNHLYNLQIFQSSNLHCHVAALLAMTMFISI